MALSDVQIRSAKPSDRVLKLSDGGGLQLWIEPDGGKRWRLMQHSAATSAASTAFESRNRIFRFHVGEAARAISSLKQRLATRSL